MQDLHMQCTVLSQHAWWLCRHSSALFTYYTHSAHTPSESAHSQTLIPMGIHTQTSNYTTQYKKAFLWSTKGSAPLSPTLPPAKLSRDMPGGSGWSLFHGSALAPRYMYSHVFSIGYCCVIL